jgi:hypothetical protein
MDRIKLALGLTAILCTATVYATPASAFKTFKSKGICINPGEFGCPTSGEGGEQKFTFGAMKAKCSSVNISEAKAIEVVQGGKTVVVIVNDVQGQVNTREVAPTATETGEASTVLPEYKSCKATVKEKELETTIAFGKEKSRCVYEFLASGSMSIKPEGCALTFEAIEKEKPICKVEIKDVAGNQNLKGIEYTNIEGLQPQVEITAKVKTITGTIAGTACTGKEEKEKVPFSTGAYEAKFKEFELEIL